MLKVDRIKSNKLINNLKIITFAGILALSHPINVNASEEVSMEETVETEEKGLSTLTKIKIGTVAIPLIYVLLVEFNVYNEISREEKKIEIKSKKKDSE